MKTIHFEDHGQDFLEWDIDADGHVIACRPFQGWVWCKRQVLNTDLKPGDTVFVRNPDGGVSHMNYSAERVIDNPSNLKVFCSLNGEEWYVGESRDAVLDFVREELGEVCDDENDDLEEVAGGDLDRLRVTVGLDDMGERTVERSFRAHLDREAAEGGQFPRHFASSNY